MNERVLVTGAGGFVGTVLCEQLAAAGFRVRAALRTDRSLLPSVAEKEIVGDIGRDTDWNSALAGVDHVVHLAARVHVLHDRAGSENLYLETNTFGTQALAQAAIAAGVRRFVFLSTIKVNGEETRDRPFSASDPPRPLDAYGQSKWRAEQSLGELSAAHGLEVVVIRPPLVYGPGVKANFLRLMAWVAKGRPLPLGSVVNSRSMVSVWNLCDLVVRSLGHPAAPATWLISDGEDLSTPELIRRFAREMHRPARLLNVPPGVLQLMGTLTGRGAEVRRLRESLTVDMAATRARLEWTPPLTVDAGLRRTVGWFLSREISS